MGQQDEDRGMTTEFGTMEVMFILTRVVSWVGEKEYLETWKFLEGNIKAHHYNFGEGKNFFYKT